MLKSNDDIVGDLVMIRLASTGAVASVTEHGYAAPLVQGDYAYFLDMAIKSTRLIVIPSKEGVPRFIAIYMN